MVAYSFRRRFVEPILDGSKRQTIRAERKRHARPGEDLQLYTGMRTRSCKLISRARCTAVVPVRLGFHLDHGPLNFVVDGRTLSADEMEAFAQADGFDAGRIAVLDMCEFWFREHGTAEKQLDFSGVMIRWAPLAGEAAQ